MRALLLAGLVVGCGFSGGTFGGDAGGGDARVDARLHDTPPGDGAPDGTPYTGCFGRWHAHSVSAVSVASVGGVNTSGFERDPFISPDETVVYFARGPVNTIGDIYRGERGAITDGFSNVNKVETLSSGGDDAKVSFTDDGLFAALASNRDGQLLLYGASRPNTTAAWGAPTTTMFATIDATHPNYDPQLTGDGLRVYLAPVLGGSQSLAMAARASTTVPFGAYTPLATLNLGGNAADPAVTADELVIVFSTTRPGTTGSGDLWYATRTSTALAFEAPQHLNDAAVNTNLDEGDPQLSADGCRLYFSRNIGGGDFDLYMATLAP